MKGTLSVFKQVNDLQMQIAAKSSRKYASPQPAATIITRKSKSPVSPRSSSGEGRRSPCRGPIYDLRPGIWARAPQAVFEYAGCHWPHLLVEYCGRHELWNAHHDFEQGRGKVKQGYPSSGKCFRRHETSSTEAHALEIAALARGGYLTPCSKYDWVWRHTREPSRQA